MDKVFNRISVVFSMGLLLLSASTVAEQAVLVDEGVLVEVSPDPEEPAFYANYVSEDGWVVTSKNYIDVVAMVFDFGEVQSVSSATLSLPLEAFYSNGSQVLLELVAYPDDGVVDVYDYKASTLIPVAEFNPLVMSGFDSSATLTFDVTGAVNSNLRFSRYVAFRVRNTIEPEDVKDGYPGHSGVKFRPEYSLEFSTDGELNLPADRPRFDGYSLSIPNVVVPNLGIFNVEMNLENPVTGLFSLSTAVDVSPTGFVSGAGRTGTELLSCDEFTAPVGAQSLTPGDPSLDLISGILSVPSLIYDGIEYTLQLQFEEGSSPLLFSFVSLDEAGSTGAEANISQFGGSLVTQPTQDFIPLCHGWVLIGDTNNHTLVERNIITGETGATYAMNLDTRPDEMLLDEDNGLVYLTAHPETERVYKLDLSSGAFTYHHLASPVEPWRHFVPMDIALSEEGNLLVLLQDLRFEKEQEPPAKFGRWIGAFSNIGEPLSEPIPLILPERIEYDPVQKHVLLGTESNLVTFDYDSLAAGTVVDPAFIFVVGTDIKVGAGCTDLSISPDGNRLAYSCPEGNRNLPDTSIVDMAPRDYLDADGEWLLEGAPASAAFDNTGEVLIATDNQKLYFFDSETHLLHDSYALNLEAGESVNKVRVSRDGGLVLILTQTDIHGASSKVHWLPLPSFAP